MTETPAMSATAPAAPPKTGDGTNPAGEKTVRLEKAVALLAVAAAAFTVLALLIISFYNFPVVDDFGFNTRAHDAWQQTGSVFGLLRGAWDSTIYYVQTWAGSYSTLFFCSLGGMSISVGAHQWQLFLYTLLFVASIVTFFFTVSRRYLGLKWWHIAFLTSGFVFLFFNFTPLAWSSEVLPWLAAICGYSLPFTWLLFFFSLLFLQPKTRWGGVLVKIGLVVLAVLIAGSHINSSLPMVAYALVFLAVRIVWDARHKQKILFSALLAALLAVLFLANILAPGNALRQDSWGTSYAGSPLRGAYFAVLSVQYLFMDCLLPSWILPFSVALLPFFYYIARKTSFSFRYPALPFLLAVFAVAAACFPYAYTTGNKVVEGRVAYMAYFVLVLFWYASLFYLCGWLSRRRWHLVRWQQRGLAGALALLFVFFSGMTLLGGRYTGKQILPNSVHIYRDLLNGKAGHYRQVMNENWVLLEQDDTTQVTLVRPAQVPAGVNETLVSGSDDIESWINSYIGTFFGKDVTVEDEEG